MAPTPQLNNDPDALSTGTADAWATVAAAIAAQGQGRSKTGETFKKIIKVEGRDYYAKATFVDDNGHFSIELGEPVLPRPDDDPAAEKARADAAKSTIELDLAQWASDNDIPQLKAKYDLAETHARIEKLRTENDYLPAEIESKLATAAQSIAASKAGVDQIVSEIGIAEAAAPLARAEVSARTGLIGAQATRAEIENAIAVLGPLATIEDREAALEDMVRRRVIRPEAAAQIGARFDEEIATGVPTLERFKEEKAAERQGVTEAGALQRQREQEQAKAAQALQAQQVTAATSITGDEAARERQLLSSGVSQQANQAQAVNSFINNYQQGASPIASGRGFMDGLSMVRDIFSSIKDLAQPAPQLGQAQGFIGNLLGSPAAAGGLGPPAVAGPAAPVGTGMANAAAAGTPGPVQPDYLEDPLMAATAAEDDDTLLDPGDVAQIQQLRQTDPRRAVNLTVEAWQRAVRGSGQTTRAGRAANATT